MCFGSTNDIDGQPWIITTDVYSVEIMKQTRVMAADGYIYADIYNMRQLDPSANIEMTPCTYTCEAKRTFAGYNISNSRKPLMYFNESFLNPSESMKDENYSSRIYYKYAEGTRGYINIRSETKPDDDNAKKDEFGTWTIKIEINPPENPTYNMIFALPDTTHLHARWIDIMNYDDIFNTNLKKIQKALFKINRIYAEEAKVYADDKHGYVTMPSFEYIGQAANQPIEISIPSYEKIGAFSKGVWPSLYQIT